MLLRCVEVVIGLLGAGISIFILANPFVAIGTLIVLLAVTIALDGIRLIVSNGAREWWHRIQAEFHASNQWMDRLGRIWLAVIAISIVIAVLIVPVVQQLSLLYALAVGVLVLSVARVTNIAGHDLPPWLRGASVGTGVIASLLMLLALFVPAVGLTTFAIVLAVAMLLSGVQSVVTGLRPTDPRQITLLKLVLFALFYGLVLINWIDLYRKHVPAYGVWLILTYFAPFFVILIYEGFRHWSLVLSLGLLVSLANDVGYYFVGNLLFGFHKDLPKWISGQIGLDGTTTVTYFQAGVFSIPVESWMMGLSIFLRAVVVTAGLYYWWRYPARTAPGSPTVVPSIA
jgi:uncharacterized membrane protein HdeD (DUF308 family)